MNRFLRTVYSVTYVSLFLTLFLVFGTGADVPLPAFLCLYFGMMIALFPSIFDRLAGKEPVFLPIGVLAALLGYLPILLSGCPVVHSIAYGISLFSGVLFYFLRRHKTTHAFFTGFFRTTVIVAAAVIAFITLMLIPAFYGTGAVSFGWDRIVCIANNVIPVLIMLLTTGILLLRGLRAEQNGIDDRAFKRRQIRDLLIFAALVGVVYAFHPLQYLRAALVFLRDKALLPAILWLYRLLQRTFDAVGGAFLNKQYVSEIKDAPQPEPDPTPLEPSTIFAGNTEIKDHRIDIPYETVLYILLAFVTVVLVILFVIAFRKLIRKIRSRKNQGYPNETVEKIEEETPEVREKKPKKLSADPRLRIRYQYAEFMKHLKDRRVRLKKSDTCGEIGMRARNELHADEAEMNAFSDLYERARYCAAEAPTEDDAKRMKSLLGRIRQDDRR